MEKPFDQINAKEAQITSETIRDLVEELRGQNNQLEGQLFTEFPVSDSELDTGKKLLMFNRTFPGGSYGVSTEDGPVAISKDLTLELINERRSANLAAAFRRLASKDIQAEGQIVMVADETEFAGWQSAYEDSRNIAVDKAEKMRGQRKILPKALALVRSHRAGEPSQTTS